jgi:hypothetical protein
LKRLFRYPDWIKQNECLSFLICRKKAADNNANLTRLLWGLKEKCVEYLAQHTAVYRKTPSGFKPGQQQYRGQLVLASHVQHCSMF